MKAFLPVLAVLISACGSGEPETLVLNGDTMGTQFSVQLPETGDLIDTAILQLEVERTLADVEHLMSTFTPESIISRFNRNTTTDWFTVPDDFCASIENAIAISTLTDGAFDITVGPVVNLWGFGPGVRIEQPPTDAQIAIVMAATGYENLRTDCPNSAIRKNVPGLNLDMSAYGKGYAVDRIADFLDEQKFENYLVEIGGELRVRGRNAHGEMWAIGIESPTAEERKPHTIISLTDAAVATSGDYRNFFETGGKRYSHTINPITGKPVTHSLASVTVVGEKGYRTDALATAILVLGEDRGMQLARNEDLAVLFLIRTEAGVEQRTSPAFDLLLQQKQN